MRESHPDRGGDGDLLRAAVEELRRREQPPEPQTVRVPVAEEVATFGGLVEVQGRCSRCECDVCRGKPRWEWQPQSGRLVRVRVPCPACADRGVRGVCCSRIVPVSSCLDGQTIYDDGFLRAEAAVERRETRERDGRIEADVRVDWLELLLERQVPVTLLGRSATVAFAWARRECAVLAFEGVCLCAKVVEPAADPLPALVAHLANL